MPTMMRKAADKNDDVRRWLEMIYALQEISLHREQ
jgi:hypothetical protein